MSKDYMKDYDTLRRTVAAFGGLSSSGRTVRVSETSSPKISVRETSKEFTINVPSYGAAKKLDGDQIKQARGAITRRLAQFLHSEGLHEMVEHEWKCGDHPLGAITRHCDEARSLRLTSNDLPGVRSDLSGIMRREAKATAAQLKRLAEQGSDPEKEKQAAAITAARLSKWISNGVPQTEIDDVLKNLSPEMNKVIKEAIDDGTISSIADAQTMDQSIDAAKRLYKYFTGNDADEEIEQQQQGGGGGGEGEEGDAAAASVSDAMGEGASDDPSSDSSISDEMGEKEDRQYSVGSDGNGDYIVTPAEHVHVADMTRHRGRSSVDCGVKADALLASLRRVLQVRSQAYYVGGQKRGRIQRSNLYRAGVQTVGNGDWNSRVFKKRVESDTLDTAVEILVDFSGSMYGARIDVAVEAASRMAEALQRLGIPTSVTSFSDSPRQRCDLGKIALHFGIFKDYGKMVPVEQMRDAMHDHFKSTGAGNPDACGVYHAARRVAQRRERRKVLLVLSDGHPATGRGGRQDDVLKSIIAGTPRFGVETYGIGIQSDAVQEFYPEYTVLWNTEELPKVIAQVVQKKIV